MLAKRIHQHREREEWVAGSEVLTEVVRLLRKRLPTRDIRASLAYALDDQAEFAMEMDRDDDELRLKREAYTFAARVEGLPPDEVAWFAMRLCFALCRRREFTEAIVFAEKAMAGADPDGDVAAMVTAQASMAYRRTDQVARALELAHEAVRIAESVKAKPEWRQWLIGRSQMALAMALADSGHDGQGPAALALAAIEATDSEPLLARACYVSGYVASEQEHKRRHALRAKEIFQRLEERHPGGFGPELAEVEQLLAPA